MKTSIITRIAAVTASVLVTFTTVHLIADYALTEAPATTLALAAPR